VSAQIIGALRKRADVLDKAALGDGGPPGTVPSATLTMLAHEFRMVADEAEGLGVSPEMLARLNAGVER
jgi:hypothetical protein